MYVSSHVCSPKKQQIRMVGTEIVRYDNWSTTKNLRWRLAPYDPAGNPFKMIKAMDVAGDKVFAVAQTMAEVYVYDAATGAFKVDARSRGW